MPGLRYIKQVGETIKACDNPDLELPGMKLFQVVSNESTEIFLTGPANYPHTVIEENNIRITIEGMIYNWEDTEIKNEFLSIGLALNDPTASEKKIRQFVHESDGDFWCIIENIESGDVVLFNDSWGRLPAYYYYDATRFVFARNMHYILNHISNISINKVAIAEMLSLEFNLGNKTIIDEIERAYPATIIRLKIHSDSIKTNISENRQRSIPSVSTQFDSYQDNLTACYDLFNSAVDNRLSTLSKKNLRFTADLSGGFDTRAIFIALANRKAEFSPVNDLIISGDESAVSEQLARQYGYSPVKLRAEHHWDDLRKMADLNFLTDGYINSYINRSCFHDDFERAIAFPDIGTNFMGFVGEFLRNIYRPGKLYNGFPSMITNDLYTHYVSTADSLDLLKIAPSDHTDNLHDHFSKINGADKSIIARSLFFDFCRTLVNCGEDRHRNFFWTVCPFWSNDLMQYIMTKIDPKHIGYKFFIDFLLLLDKKSLTTPFSGFEKPFSDNSTLSSFYREKKIKSILKYNRLTFKIGRKWQFRNNSLGSNDSHIAALSPQIKTIIKSSDLVNTFFDQKRVTNYIDAKANRLQFYQLISVILYLRSLEQKYPSKIK